jgi:predicted transglutaminase-like cysteine proteinase
MVRAEVDRARLATTAAGVVVLAVVCVRIHGLMATMPASKQARKPVVEASYCSRLRCRCCTSRLLLLLLLLVAQFCRKSGRGGSHRNGRIVGGRGQNGGRSTAKGPMR